VQKASRDFTINVSPQTQKTLERDPVILICNHPHQAEVLVLLGSIPHRPKTFVIIMHNFLSILPALNKHLIPVYIGHKATTRDKDLLKYKIFQKFHTTQKFTPEISHQKNIKSIALAAKKIDEGALVAIFPAGGTPLRRDFLSGLGHLIKNIKHPQKAKIVMAQIKGTSNLDYFRILPFIGKLLPKFQVDFSTPLKVSDYLSGDGRSIAKKIEVVYYHWSQNLPK